MDDFGDTMTPEERRSRHLGRMREARRRRRRNITLFVGVTVLVLAALFVVGPWGPLRGVFFGEPEAKSSAGDTGAQVGSAPDGDVAANVGQVEAGNPQAPATPARKEKKSNPAAPAIAIVVDDVAVAPDKLPLWLQIDAPISFAVLPHTTTSQSLAEELYSNGYEIMVHVPTQNEPPNSYSGEGQLEVGMTRDTVFATLDADLATVPHAEGINNHQGGAGCDSLELMTYECEWAKQHGFYVVDSNSSYHSEVINAAVSLGMKQRKNQVFIDHQNDPEYIRGTMRQLASLARQNGAAVGICHFHRPNTAAVVGEMVSTLKAEGIHFAFVRDVSNQVSSP